MLLLIDHLTRYRYDAPVRGVVQSHRLTPSLHEGQQVIDWQVTVTGGIAGGSFRDGAGDVVQGWSVKGPVSEIEVRVRGKVATTDTAGVLRGHRESVAVEAYLRDTSLTEASGGLGTLARVVEGEENRLAACHALSRAVSEAVTYVPGATASHTTAAEALEAGEGVCQDHAHILCAVARANMIPARYVSGYLLADAEGKAHQAAHAWAELFIPGLGWVGFDPANECCPDDRYVRLGSGLDAREAAPIRGSARSTGAETLDVTVAVLATQQ
ncbi:transglutaminase family protein [Stagnihabitans tardus]|uniref:Transglutaminase family protein n=1 Tax=Stagnihabitans tardus TaxID=2699202 RepID=A0AAE4Y6Z8_9RHOB|nr:transglutaminase family protein [Stagnihabitans tardus]NBZ87027.1 transglutaminase family protein [Stagnihabitans tardus]